MGNVMVIPAKRQVGNTARQQDVKPKLRVAAYCRVSTDSNEQATSYDAQVEHYTEFIQKNPEWELICTLFTGQPVRRVFLCVIVMSLN